MKFALGLLLALPLLAHADIEGRVVSIADGDTVIVLDADRVQHRVRLSGIDAPEKRQAFGQRSKQSLSDCAYGKRARIEGDKTDRYQRLIGRVVVGQVDCNLRQVQLGLAWHYKAYEREQAAADRQLYARAEAAARAQHRGLWADPDPMAPWDFRRR